MEIKKTFGELRRNRATWVIMILLGALVLVSIGAVWSPQAQAVNDVRNCVRNAHVLQVSDTRCMPLVRKMSK